MIQFWGKCYLMGAELAYNTADTILIVYDEASDSKSAARKVITLRTSQEFHDAKRTFALPGIECNGLYAAWSAGVGTVWYYDK